MEVRQQSVLTMKEVNLYISNGALDVKGLVTTPTGSPGIQELFVEGNAHVDLNNGNNWQAPVAAYCITGNQNQIPTAYLPVTSSCGTIQLGCEASTQEICDNGVDDDGDGKIDCQDGDCFCGDYQTINNGDWGNNSTWKNGNVPPYSISGETIEILHQVDVTTTNVTLDGGAEMLVNGGYLDLVGDQFDLRVRNATVTIKNGATVIVGDDLQLTSSNATITVTENSTLEVRKRMAHTEGSVILDNSSLIVGAGLSASRSCLLYTSPSPRDQRGSRMPSSA